MKLVVQRGIENVTTEEIAASAGISTRTFFNYYLNKEAAAIGEPPGYREEDMEALQTGTASLAADLKAFLDKHMETLAEDEAVLRMVGSVLRSNEKARGILDGFLASERDQLTECLFARVKDRQIAAALASNATDVTERAIRLWEQSESLSLIAALDIIWEGLLSAAQLLAASSE
ncbi:TetR/AcrR family transcriptional regulator [Labrenzia sp. CE80]|uniref:TetR/AcrR family transcriptional regulator n=1 Tax=Labrenzia sp. CE80 TaxID=1788986 RepID=UPI00138A1538|nr:TetR/AcrR family transcriptional regulator [Labrenzia sp. CE80]